MKKRQLISYLILVSLGFLYLLGYEMFLPMSEKISFKSIIIILSVFFAIVIIYALLMLYFKKTNPKIYKKLYDFIIESEDSEFDGDKYINDLRDKIVSFKFLGEEVIEKK